ncbi:MAG: DUF2442 domain-containing protein [Gemmatimonadales bacterium]
MGKRLTDQEVLAQVPAARRRADRRTAEPRIVAGRYDASREQVIVSLSNDATLALPVALIAPLAHATHAVRRELLIRAAGLGIGWPQLDLDVSLPGLAQLLCGTRTLQRAAGSAAGSVRSAAKTAAARRNGRRGGRPVGGR